MINNKQKIFRAPILNSSECVFISKILTNRHTPPVGVTVTGWACCRAVLYSILEKPDDWNIVAQSISNETGFCIISVYSYLKILREAGYLSRITYKNLNGKILGYEWAVYEEANAPFVEKTEVLIEKSEDDSQKNDTLA